MHEECDSSLYRQPRVCRVREAGPASPGIQVLPL
jgi:hypothetical protein